MKPMRVGVVGCGSISGAYFGQAPKYPSITITACADLVRDAAEARAKEFNIPKVASVDELLADPDIDCVLNLTIPRVHTEIALRALEHGKHTYSEKPFALDRAEGRKVLDLAKKKGLSVGCAPDTFLGAGQQTSRKLIDDGVIGRPVAATAFMLSPGHESWHPNPEFYYDLGGGPMLDMGPYYLTAMVNMFGPIKRVSGATAIAIPERTITHKNKEGGPGPKFGKKIKVVTPDHVAGTIEFASGVLATVIMSFAVQAHPFAGQPITVFGSEGTMRVPDPNGFDGPVEIATRSERKFAAQEWTHAKGYARAAGLADMALAIQQSRPARVSGDLAMHVLDAMLAFLDAGQSGKAIDMTTTTNRPAPLPAGKPFGTLD
ncbi:MAG: gfo/Idh/MocA family oxidoreductase [Phycisphaera sp.]|nr:gfo/Idh/MocA family oxidoreductase [Phycisphaera sp.]